ncbi:MAG: hypothetical protein EBT79_02545 [Actinobacteria bacterium]|nr:hypothetical protein [Actinomycetota bacterium]NBR66155.1 hypothetical protein [Actinomycetota bacterium]
MTADIIRKIRNGDALSDDELDEDTWHMLPREDRNGCYACDRPFRVRRSTVYSTSPIGKD